MRCSSIKGILLLTAFSALLGACSGSFYLGSGGGGGAPPAPGSITSGPSGLRANINTNPGPWFGAVILGVAIAGGVSEARSPAPAGGGTPPMDEGRSVNVQDCTRPIEPGLGNLRCR